MKRCWRSIGCSAVVGFVVGCRTFSPTPIDQVPFKERAETQTRDGVTVSVVVLTAEEARAAFDDKLYKKKIQPVWLEITNGADDEMLFMPRSIDPKVDETRAALVQDFIHAQALRVFATAGGVGFVSPHEPRGNLTGDPWFTDGKRAVMLLTGEPTRLPRSSGSIWRKRNR